MNKQQFLDKLKDRLGILTQSEVQDILDEYADTIDQKVQEGMSEEDAVKDFGDVDELAKEILQAYKINTNKRNDSTEDIAAKIGQVLNEVVDFLVRFFTTLFKDVSVEGIYRIVVLIAIGMILIFFLQIPFAILRVLAEVFLNLIMPYGLSNVLYSGVYFILQCIFAVISILVIISFVRIGINGDEINAENLFKKPLTEGFKFDDSKFKKEKNTKAAQSEEPIEDEIEKIVKEEIRDSIKQEKRVQKESSFGKGIIVAVVWMLRIIGFFIMLPLWMIVIASGITLGILVYLYVIGLPILGIIFIGVGIFGIVNIFVNMICSLIFNKGLKIKSFGILTIIFVILIGIGLPLTMFDLTRLDVAYVGQEESMNYIDGQKGIIGEIPYNENQVYQFYSENISFVLDPSLENEIVIEGDWIDFVNLMNYQNVEEQKTSVFLYVDIESFEDFKDYMKANLNAIKDGTLLISAGNQIEATIRVPESAKETFKYRINESDILTLKN